MNNLTIADDLNAINAVVCEAKSVADITTKYIEDMDFNSLKDSKLQLIYAVDAISRILLIADDNLTKLASYYSRETDDKSTSIICKELELTQ